MKDEKILKDSGASINCRRSRDRREKNYLFIILSRRVDGRRPPSRPHQASHPAPQVKSSFSSLSLSFFLSLSLSLSKHALGKDLSLRLSIAAVNLGLAFSTNLLHLLTSLSFFALQETAELLASCVAVCAPSCGRGHIQCHDHDYGRVSFRSHHLQPDFR